jgi:subtilisin family serine protease
LSSPKTQNYAIGFSIVETIVPVKVLNSNGEGSYADIIAGIDWMIGEHNKSPTKRSVANLSLGGEKSTALNSAIARAAAAGIVMVVAAGNANKGKNSSQTGKAKAFT